MLAHKHVHVHSRTCTCLLCLGLVQPICNQIKLMTQSCKTVKSTDLDLQNHPQKCNKETKSLQPSLPGKNACSKFYVKAYPAEKCQYEKDNPKQ